MVGKAGQPSGFTKAASTAADGRAAAVQPSMIAEGLSAVIGLAAAEQDAGGPRRLHYIGKTLPHCKFKICFW